MANQRTRLGLELEKALGEALADARGEHLRLLCWRGAENIVAPSKRMKLSRKRFADRFGRDARAVQDWEQGWRVPDRAAHVLLTVIEREPEAVVRALGG